MSNFLGNFLKFKQKVNTSGANKLKQKTQEDFKMNLKGQRVTQSTDGPGLDFDIPIKEKGPPMLNMRTRVKVWAALFGMGVYFYLCYKLIRFRLKADDLDLMEREVNEEYKLKMKLKEINNK